MAGIPHTQPAQIRRRVGVLPESAGYPGTRPAGSTCATTRGSSGRRRADAEARTAAPARPGGSGRARGVADLDLQPWHAPAPRHRPRPGERSGRRLPGRADARPRPGRPAPGAGSWSGTSRGAAGRHRRAQHPHAAGGRAGLHRPSLILDRGRVARVRPGGRGDPRRRRAPGRPAAGAGRVWSARRRGRWRGVAGLSVGAGDDRPDILRISDPRRQRDGRGPAPERRAARRARARTYRCCPSTWRGAAQRRLPHHDPETGDGMTESTRGAGWRIVAGQECRDLWLTGRGPVLLFAYSVLLSAMTYLAAHQRGAELPRAAGGGEPDPAGRGGGGRARHAGGERRRASAASGSAARWSTCCSPRCPGAPSWSAS